MNGKIHWIIRWLGKKSPRFIFSLACFYGLLSRSLCHLSQMRSLISSYIPMVSLKFAFAHETRIRDAYSANLAFHRPSEALVKREVSYSLASVRADMRTVDRDDILREWEFKLIADYSALGQIMTYVALARREYKFKRQVRGVIAAFETPDLIRETIETMNLGVELVAIPYYLCAAGKVPLLRAGISCSPTGLFIPDTSHLISPHHL